MTPAIKVCPRCQQAALLHAPDCTRCGHAFRTQFTAAGAPLVQPNSSQITLTPATRPPQRLAYCTHRRTRTGAIVWCRFLGGVGAHKFYLGQPGWGIAYASLSWTFLPAVAALFELFRFLGMSDEAFDRIYVPNDDPDPLPQEPFPIVAALAAVLLVFSLLGVFVVAVRNGQRPMVPTTYYYPAPPARAPYLMPHYFLRQAPQPSAIYYPPAAPAPRRYVVLPPATIEPPWHPPGPSLPPPHRIWFQRRD